MNNEINFDGIWKKVLRNRASRLGMSESEASKSVESPYHAAVREKAERLGISLEQASRPRAGSGPYPTPDCISTSEFTDFLTGEDLSEEMIVHIDQCACCYALLEMSSPSEDGLKALLEVVRIEAAAHAINKERDMARIFEPPLALSK